MDFERLQADVLVIGGGAAGCRAAIEAHDRGVQVTLVVKGRFAHTGSTFYPLTTGLGYTTALLDGASAGPEAHYQEIMAAGQGMVSPTLARILAQEAPARLADLLDRYEMAFRKEGGEVLYLKPDFGSGRVRAGSATVAAIRESFEREVRKRDIRLLEETAITRLLGDRDGCVGAVGVSGKGDVVVIAAKATVLATGGGSTVFFYHMNTPDLTFDGHGMALELGADVVNMEFYQMILGLTSPVRRMLIPESYLALQPFLTNGLGEEFLARYLPDDRTTADCLNIRAGTGPFRSDAAAKYFDIAIFDEVRADRGTDSGGVQADFTACDPAQIRGGKLDWFEWARARGVDLCARPVDISPHVHAFNGGVLINSEAETTVPNLFACGEVAGGPHGANRIGGNQFAGSQVFGERAGRFAAAQYGARAAELEKLLVIKEQIAEVGRRLAALQRRESGRTPPEIQRAIQTVMWNGMGVYKDAVSLRRCQEQLSIIEGDLSALYLPRGRHFFLALSLPHQLATAMLIAGAASMRRESRGPHYRTDFPSPDDVRLQPIVANQEGGQLQYRFHSLK